MRRNAAVLFIEASRDFAKHREIQIATVGRVWLHFLLSGVEIATVAELLRKLPQALLELGDLKFTMVVLAGYEYADWLKFQSGNGT